VEPPRAIRVVTFNLFHGGPWSSWNGETFDLDARLEMATRELRALEPDVVTLQEASQGRRRGVVARRLAEALGFHYVFEPATTHLSPLGPLNRLIVAGLDFAEGSAVLSRFPIAGSDVSTLPRCRSRLDPRILLRADVATPWGALAVFTTHTSADPCQVNHVSALVRAHARMAPVILTGDFNMPETHEAIVALNGEGGFVDAFRAAHPDAPGATVYQRPGASVPTVSRRVDYIFVGGVADRGRVVCSSRVVLDQPGRTPDGRKVWPSDHYGVLADVDPFGIKCAP
jgi:endonuclease/exonuclease/phosphatase family metal-dependent hydrolase